MPVVVHGQGYSDVDDISGIVRKYGQAEVLINYPGYDAMTQLAEKFSVSSCDGKTALLSLSPLTAPAFIGTGIPYKIIIPEGIKSVYTATSAAEAMQWHSYPTRQQYDTIMNMLAATWPDVCVLDTIGFSILGRAILVLRITDNPTADEDEPAVMLSAVVHGDELAGFVLLMRLAEQLASGSNDGGLISKLTSGLDIYINPLANPDGMYRNGDTIIFPVRANSNGYDINRNFPDPEVTSPPPLQPETVSMMEFMRQNRISDPDVAYDKMMATRRQENSAKQKELDAAAVAAQIAEAEQRGYEKKATEMSMGPQGVLPTDQTGGIAGITSRMDPPAKMSEETAAKVAAGKLGDGSLAQLGYDMYRRGELPVQ